MASNAIVETAQPRLKVIVVGDPCAGKSTLTAALKNEKSFLALLFTCSYRKVVRVGVHGQHKVGMIPHDFVSKTFGPVTLYDFTSHPEFYSTHAAWTSPAIFLLVVNLCESREKLKQTILYWLFFLKNQCTSVSSKPHVVFVGSHADVLRTKGENVHQMSNLVDSIITVGHYVANFHFDGFIALDCRYSESSGMNELRQTLRSTCFMLRSRESEISVSAHRLLVYLLDKFTGYRAVNIKHIETRIQSENKFANESHPLFFLPSHISGLYSLCDELNDRGHILFLKDPVFIENSWIIIDKAALLSEVTGTIFAPENFEQHCKLASSTGVVPVSYLSKALPQHKLEMLVSFLSHLEFCHEIDDQEVLQLASEQHQTTSEEAVCSPSDRYLLFPALISLDVPQSELWGPHPKFNHFGWMLKCSRSEMFLTSRFLQVLLLRLAFSYAFPLWDHDFPALRRKCSLWKNGIYWGNRDDVETLVQVVERNKAVIVLMRCPELTSEYLQLRSSVIQKVLAAASEFCGNVDTMESFIDPSETIKYPLKPTSELTLFSLPQIAEAVVNEISEVVCLTGNTMLYMPLDKLLVSEAYSQLGIPVLCQLFSSELSTTVVSNHFLTRFADRIRERKDASVKLYKADSTLGSQSHSDPGDTDRIVCALKRWRDRCKGTYQCLRKTLDRWSVFAGRNPMKLACVSDHPLQSAEDTSIGTRVFSRKVIVLTSSARDFEWEEAGIKLHVPAGCLPRGVEKATMEISVILGKSKMFVVPEDYKLVSSVYALEVSCKLNNAVELEVQHCVNVTSAEDCDHLLFVHAEKGSDLSIVPFDPNADKRCQSMETVCELSKSDQGEIQQFLSPDEHVLVQSDEALESSLAIQFDPISGKFFKKGSLEYYGKLSLSRFSYIAILLKKLFHRETYHAYVKTSRKLIGHPRAYFIVTKRLNTHKTAVNEEFPDDDFCHCTDFSFEFDADEIYCEVPVTTRTGWEISPMTNAIIRRDNVDELNDCSLRSLPKCEFLLKCPQQKILLEHDVYFSGARHHTFFKLIFDPNDSITTDPGQQPPICRSLLSDHILAVNHAPLSLHTHSQKQRTTEQTSDHILAIDHAPLSLHTHNQEQWITEQTSGSHPSPRPELKDLILLDIRNWYNIGVRLGLHGRILWEIERDYNQHCDRKRAMFEAWIRNCDNVSYHHLYKELKAVGEHSAAQAIKDKIEYC